MVETTLRYLADMAERPVYYLHEPPPGTPSRNARGDRQRMPIHNARELSPAPTLDLEGFTLEHLESAVENLYAAAVVRSAYYREVEQLVGRVTGAARVVAFDHNVRCSLMAAQGENGAQNPVKFPHNDYTERSAPQRVRDLLGELLPESV